ncbi:cysteine synthase A [Saccharopolyspora kobensis]|uniref:Cysteine synthase A n=1 Tax=Saccharopolyspora kobensis TaxID=146035 RepID=A0A1H5VAL4_9PSEU|nr:PLP-dependent cysteine synthase family protein [Saccharopolyspora kobensis]SEF83858.1 cysteine synthase A [Saccharopolyspora kobensis]SFC63546.1 cysteine synthase A [Saccharopolyspora kobensis]
MTVSEPELRPYEAELADGAVPAQRRDGVVVGEFPGLDDLDNPHYRDERRWVAGCVARIRSMPRPVTPLHEIALPAQLAGLKLYIKDETVHPTKSHKHRLAEALFLNAFANGWLRSDGPVVEASSGSTAISEAWFCRELGMRFLAVVPAGTAARKKKAISELGGEIKEASGAAISAVARKTAQETNGHFMDQFTYAERAYDWRADHGIAAEVIEAVDPDWFVMGAGTGGTVASVARYARYCDRKVKICVTDPENSAFFPGWRDDDRAATAPGSRIEGIGRPVVEPSFLFPLVNRMIRVPDPASIAAMRVAADRLGVRPGASTGTALYGALKILHGMHERGETGTVVTVLCDPGERYLDTYYDDDWLAQRGIDHTPWVPVIEDFLDHGTWHPPATWTAPPVPATVLWNM